MSDTVHALAYEHCRLIEAEELLRKLSLPDELEERRAGVVNDVYILKTMVYEVMTEAEDTEGEETTCSECGGEFHSYQDVPHGRVRMILDAGGAHVGFVLNVLEASKALSADIAACSNCHDGRDVVLCPKHEEAYRAKGVKKVVCWDCGEEMGL